MDRTERDLLRHTLATLSYRAAKTIHEAPPEFATFDGGGRTPHSIVGHLGDLIEWALSMADGRRVWQEAVLTSWSQDAARFFAAMQSFDDYLASDQELKCDGRKLFQGPIADALTHVGQLAMLRRMAGAPIVTENYFAAEVTTGRVGADQAPPRRPIK